MAIRKKLEGPQSPGIADLIMQIGLTFTKIGGDGTKWYLDSYQMWKRVSCREPQWQEAQLRLCSGRKRAGSIGSSRSEMARMAMRCKLAPKPNETAINLQQLGEFFQLQGEYGKAREAYKQALASAQPELKARVLLDIAHISFIQHDYQKSYEETRQSVELYGKQTPKDWLTKGVYMCDDNVGSTCCEIRRRLLANWTRLFTMPTWP